MSKDEKGYDIPKALMCGAFCSLGFIIGGPVGLFGAALIVLAKG